LGDSSKAKNLLNWKPKVDFDGLVKLMVEEDIELAKQEKTLLDNNLIKPTWENAI
jgi:GDPmannose 4,6-dehydratase